MKVMHFNLFCIYSHNKCSDPEDEWDTTTTLGQQDNPSTVVNDMTDNDNENINTTKMISDASLGMSFILIDSKEIFILLRIPAHISAPK